MSTTENQVQVEAPAPAPTPAVEEPLVVADDVEAEKSQLKKSKGHQELEAQLGRELTETEREMQDAMDATWGEVLQACFVGTPKEWGIWFVTLLAALFFLYWFLVAIKFMGDGAKVMTGCAAGGLFGETNPVAGVMIGMLVTVLLQSSSTTTSIIVSMVPDVISVDQGIYMVMGANIGTSVTNTIVAMGQMGDGLELERAFAGATIHDLFNFLTVGVLLPIEVITGYLARVTEAMVKGITVSDGESKDSFLDPIINPIANRIIKSNKNVMKHVANGGSCNDFYPIECTDGIESKKTCDVALIACTSEYGCPIFFDQKADQAAEVTAGAVAFILSIMLLFLCLAGLVTVLKRMLFGVSSRIIYKATNLNGYICILIGTGITIAVQSSSITTCVLTPLVGIGVLPLESMLPLTLGANIGTTITGLMASLVSDSVESLQVALAHLMFNITGIIIWYPIPLMRAVPLRGARLLGKMTRVWKGFPLLYLAIVFFLVPAYFLAISTIFTQKTLAMNIIGSILVILTAFALGKSWWWCKREDGWDKMLSCFNDRQRRSEAIKTIADDMDHLRAENDSLKRKISILMAHTGAPDDEEDEEMQKLMDENADMVKEDIYDDVDQKIDEIGDTTHNSDDADAAAAAAKEEAIKMSHLSV